MLPIHIVHNSKFNFFQLGLCNLDSSTKTSYKVDIPLPVKNNKILSTENVETTLFVTPLIWNVTESCSTFLRIARFTGTVVLCCWTYHFWILFSAKSSCFTHYFCAQMKSMVNKHIQRSWLCNRDNNDYRFTLTKQT